jgi:transcriptional regulator with XRE-family HTH domain
VAHRIISSAHVRFNAWAEGTGQTLTQLGARLGCDSSYVSSLRRGLKWPGRRVANTIERVCGIAATDWDEAEDAVSESATDAA